MGMDEPVNGNAGKKILRSGRDMMQDLPPSAPPTPSAPVQPSAEQLDAVAASLRQAYSATVAEDIPQSLMDLLQQLR
jgi:Anti-sigma factor NepR